MEPNKTNYGTTGYEPTTGTMNIEQQGQTQQQHKSWREMSPEEVKENVREKVAKGVAAIAGAIKGFADEAKKTDLANSTKQAIQQAGDTTRQVASTTKEEFKRTKDEVAPNLGKGKSGNKQGGGQGGGSQNQPMGAAYVEETIVTGTIEPGRESMGGSRGSVGGSQGSDVPDLRKTNLGSQRDIRESERNR